MMGWAKTHYGYGNLRNHQKYINKTCWYDLAFLSCHIVFKDLSRLIIFYRISFRPAKAPPLEIGFLNFSCITITLHDILNENKSQRSIF